MRTLNRSMIDHIVLQDMDFETQLVICTLSQFASDMLEENPDLIHDFAKKYGSRAADLIAPDVL